MTNTMETSQQSSSKLTSMLQVPDLGGEPWSSMRNRPLYSRSTSLRYSHDGKRLDALSAEPPVTIVTDELGICGPATADASEFQDTESSSLLIAICDDGSQSAEAAQILFDIKSNPWTTASDSLDLGALQHSKDALAMELDPTFAMETLCSDRSDSPSEFGSAGSINTPPSEVESLHEANAKVTDDLARKLSMAIRDTVKAGEVAAIAAQLRADYDEDEDEDEEDENEETPLHNGQRAMDAAEHTPAPLPSTAFKIRRKSVGSGSSGKSGKLMPSPLSLISNESTTPELSPDSIGAVASPASLFTLATPKFQRPRLSLLTSPSKLNLQRGIHEVQLVAEMNICEGAATPPIPPRSFARNTRLPVDTEALVFHRRFSFESSPAPAFESSPAPDFESSPAPTVESSPAPTFEINLQEPALVKLPAVSQFLELEMGDSLPIPLVSEITDSSETIGSPDSINASDFEERESRRIAWEAACEEAKLREEAEIRAEIEQAKLNRANDASEEVHNKLPHGLQSVTSPTSVAAPKTNSLAQQLSRSVRPVNNEPEWVVSPCSEAVPATPPPLPPKDLGYTVAAPDVPPKDGPSGEQLFSPTRHLPIDVEKQISMMPAGPPPDLADHPALRGLKDPQKAMRGLRMSSAAASRSSSGQSPKFGPTRRPTGKRTSQITQRSRASTSSSRSSTSPGGEIPMPTFEDAARYATPGAGERWRASQRVSVASGTLQRARSRRESAAAHRERIRRETLEGAAKVIMAQRELGLCGALDAETNADGIDMQTAEKVLGIHVTPTPTKLNVVLDSGVAGGPLSSKRLGATRQLMRPRKLSTQLCQMSRAGVMGKILH